jgi:hypothetical protein
MFTFQRQRKSNISLGTLGMADYYQHGVVESLVRRLGRGQQQAFRGGGQHEDILSQVPEMPI